MKGGATIADTFEWCESCWLRDKGKPLSNYGGECCNGKHKSPPGKECPYWIRDKEK